MAQIPKPCTWNGITYESMKDAAIDLGVPYTTLVNWVNQGWTQDADVHNPGRTGKPCVWNRIRYKSQNCAARATGRSNPYMGYLLKKGYECDDDLPGIARACVWNGVQYESIAAAARHLGITREAMRLRVNNGYICDSDLKRKD